MIRRLQMQRGTRGRTRQGGFTLLEVMVALAILASSIVVLLRIVTTNIQNTHRARMLTLATFLARAKIVEIEDRVFLDGFADFTEETAGDFSGEGHPEVAWTAIVERVELPVDLAQQAQQGAADLSSGTPAGASANPLSFMAGFMGGFMSTLIDPIRIGLQESVRRVTVSVSWHELGRGERTFEVVTFLTDPAKLDMAMGTVGGGLPGAGAQPGQGAPGSGTGQPGLPGGLPGGIPGLNGAGAGQQRQSSVPSAPSFLGGGR